MGNENWLVKVKQKFTSMDFKGKVKLLSLIVVLAIIGIVYINSNSNDVDENVSEIETFNYYVSSLKYCEIMEDTRKSSKICNY